MVKTTVKNYARWYFFGANLFKLLKINIGKLQNLYSKGGKF